MGYNDSDLTLGDLRRLDEDNFQHLDEHECKEYLFDTPNKAKHFMGLCINEAMKKCGVEVIPGMPGEMIERLCELNNVKVESRNYGKDEEIYMDGLYIYKNKEIAFFVSVPFARKEDVVWGKNDSQSYAYIKVKTNVKGIY